MAKCKKEEDYYSKWLSLLKTGNIKEVLVETKGKHIDEKEALACLSVISQHAYEFVKGEDGCVKLINSAHDVFHLTEFFCSLIGLESTIHTIKYLTCLYHIMFFLLEKDHFDHVTKLFKTVVKIKQNHRKSIENEGNILYDAYVSLLKKTIGTYINKENDTEKLFSLLLEMLSLNKVLHKGTFFLNTILQNSQMVGKEDQKAAVRMITTGLLLFYKQDKILDKDSCLPVLFKIYLMLYIFQVKLTGHCSALSTVDGHLNKAKWKFSESLHQAECFLLLCNSVKLFKWDCPENILLKKVEENTKILKSFKNISENSCETVACTLMISFIVNLQKTTKQSVPVFTKNSIKPFLQMVLCLYSIVKDYNNDKSVLIQCLCDIFLFISHGGNEHDKEVLKQCLEIVIETEAHVVGILKKMRSNNHVNTKLFTKSFLVRYTNLVQRYHLASTPQEVVSVTKPICKFICSLPSDDFEDTEIQQITGACFTYLLRGLSIKQLDKVLECIVIWLSVCPQTARKAFKVWGDFKHNQVCAGSEDFLETTVWTIVTERRLNLESEWQPCVLTNSEIGNYLVEELRTYFVNKSLRGKPVIAAANDLLALDTDCHTQVKGVVIAMDIASATRTYYDECCAYYTKTKSLTTKLRKEKKKIDPVNFNCCIGDLLYAQLRCQLSCLRHDCESEIVRLTIAPRQPLVEELPENRPDPNDTCDVTTKYNNLCLSKQRKMMENMDSALRHWEFAYTMAKETQNIDVDFLVTLENLQNAGFLLKLYCDEIKQAKVWKLLYNMATLAEDYEKIIIAVGEIMNIAGEIDQDYVESANKILQTQKLSNEVKRAFFLNHSVYNLNVNKLGDGLKLLIGVESEAKESSNLQYIQFLSIIGEYQKHSDWDKYKQMFISSPSYHFSLHAALSRLLYLVEKQKWGSFSEACLLHLQLVRVSRLLGEANWHLMQPREARLYLKSQLSLAQKLALPLRTVQLLLLLAWVDLDTGVVDDCAVKLEGLEDLLDLCGTPLVYGQSSPCNSSNKGMISKPEYLTHPASCNCLPCTTIEYRRLVLETITLRARFCAAFGRPSDSLQCFQVAICVQQDLCKSRRTEVVQSCVHMWIRYADTLAHSKEYEEALSANTKAMELLSFVKDSNILNHVLEQHESIQHCVDRQYYYSPISAKTDVSNEKTPTKTSQSPRSFKTPKTNIPQIKSPLSAINNNIPVTPFARPRVRPLNLYSSSNENTPVTVSKIKPKTKLPKFVTEIPQTITKNTGTPFVVFGDDCKSECASSSIVNQTTLENKNKNVKPIKKTLFSSSNSAIKCKTDNVASVDEINDNIIRKSKNKTGIKTYGTKNLTKKKTNPKENENGETFLFDQIKNAIDNIDENFIENTPSRNPPSSKSPTSLSITKKPATKKNNTFCFGSEFKTSHSSVLTEGNKTRGSDRKSSVDCDFIEGTPPEAPKKTILNLRPKRATRSNKV